MERTLKKIGDECYMVIMGFVLVALGCIMIFKGSK